jgi:hypothetical protein
MSSELLFLLNTDFYSKGGRANIPKIARSIQDGNKFSAKYFPLKRKKK